MLSYLKVLSQYQRILVHKLISFSIPICNARPKPHFTFRSTTMVTINNNNNACSFHFYQRHQAKGNKPSFHYNNTVAHPEQSYKPQYE